MAKVTMRMAPPDSPIYSGEYVISSPKSSPESNQSSENLPINTDGQPETPLEAQPEEEMAPDLHNMPYDLTTVARKIAEALEAQQLSEEKAEKE